MRTAESWSTHELIEFLATVSACRDETEALKRALETIVRTLDADLGAVVDDGEVTRAIGVPVDDLRNAGIVALASGRPAILDVPGGDRFHIASVPLDEVLDRWVVVGRNANEGLSRYRKALLLDMVRVLRLALRMVRGLVEERALRQRVEREVEERERVEERLAYAAMHDALTGLPNRALLMDRLGHALERSRRDGSIVAVLFVDIDHFRVINDGLGHQDGDWLLRMFAHRIDATLRTSDTLTRLGPETLARAGGDEFVILCEDLEATGDAIGIAERLQEGLVEPFSVGGRELPLRASIGIAVSEGTATSADLMVRQADLAMSRANKVGGDRYEVFEEEMLVDLRDRIRVIDDLRDAIDRDEMRLHYQPIIRLEDGAVIGFEALLRWAHPDHGLVAPMEFLPIAEESGLMSAIGIWVLETASEQLVGWDRAYPERPPLHLHVNLSARQLSRDLVGTVTRVLGTAAIDPGRLTLEVAESVLADRAESAGPVLEEIRRAGARVALDDFGTGASSLGHLVDMPLDEIKLDQAFVGRLGRNPSADRIVAATIETGLALGLSVIAEGIERADQLQSLRRFGYPLGQGFYFAAPQPADAVTSLLGRPLPRLVEGD